MKEIRTTMIAFSVVFTMFVSFLHATLFVSAQSLQSESIPVMNAYPLISPLPGDSSALNGMQVLGDGFFALVLTILLVTFMIGMWKISHNIKTRLHTKIKYQHKRNNWKLSSSNYSFFH